MDIFTKKTLLLRLVILLIFLNAGIIGFYWYNSTHAKGSDSKKEIDKKELSGILKKELGLSESQTKDFNTIRSAFSEKEKMLHTIVKSERDSLNMMMFGDDFNKQELTLLAKAVADNQYKMELLRIEQSAQIRAICSPEQLMKFKSLISEMKNYLKPEERQTGK
jgi:Spy/CpxP family protein refolding chaperone